MSGRARPRGRRFLLVAAAAAGILAGCATAPVRPAVEWLGILPADATMYIALDVRQAADSISRALEGKGPDAKDIGSLLRSTRRAWASVTDTAAGPASFSVVALGDYPSGLMGMRLRWSPGWTETDSAAGTWYRSRKTGIELSAPSGFVVLASGGPAETADMEGLLARYNQPRAAPVPPEVAADMETAAVVLYLPKLPGGLAAAPGGTGLPVREVWMDGRRNGTRWDITGTAITASEQDARGLVILAKLALVAWLRGQGLPDPASRLKTVTVTAEGSRVRLAGLSFADEEVVPLLGSLLLGSSASPAGSGAPPR